MIPKECKRLAEVDFPIAEVSKHAAREKSIRHGHPSTLHLWRPRRPLDSSRPGGNPHNRNGKQCCENAQCDALSIHGELLGTQVGASFAGMMRPGTGSPVQLPSRMCQNRILEPRDSKARLIATGVR